MLSNVVDRDCFHFGNKQKCWAEYGDRVEHSFNFVRCSVFRFAFRRKHTLLV